MTQTNKPSKYYITTSIPYANAKPHLGHAMEFINADVMARYHHGLGSQVRFQIGTDEHGQKLFEAAEQAGEETKAFVNKMSETFENLARDLNISHNYFVRTTDEAHKVGAQKLWEACQEDIYKGEYKGLYCVACELFYTSKDAVDDCCPVHPNRQLQELAIESYFLKLKGYQDRLIKAIESDYYRVFPALRKNEVLSFLKNNELQDLSISRPKSQLEWGVEVPGDEDHVMYVWFDALANYITTIGYGYDEEELAKFWPADLHIVGKDISRFHAVYWPIMLMSAGLELPKALYVHGFINAPGGLKMSKSLGNSVEPADAIAKYGVDALRYYLLREIPSDGDGEFGLERLGAVYNSDLANGLGNLVQRVASMTIKYCDGEFKLGEEASRHEVGELLKDCAFDRALDGIFESVRSLNQKIEESRPWEMAKEDSTGVAKLLNDLTTEIVWVGECLSPFLPDTAEKIEATFKDGKVDASVGILFPRID